MEWLRLFEHQTRQSCPGRRGSLATSVRRREQQGNWGAHVVSVALGRLSAAALVTRLTILSASCLK
jgi:lipoprotein NlpI